MTVSFEKLFSVDISIWLLVFGWLLGYYLVVRKSESPRPQTLLGLSAEGRAINRDNDRFSPSPGRFVRGADTEDLGCSSNSRRGKGVELDPYLLDMMSASASRLRGEETIGSASQVATVVQEDLIKLFTTRKAGLRMSASTLA
jgi:hypothetical protein